MDEINVMDRVQIVRTEFGAPDLSWPVWTCLYGSSMTPNVLFELDNGGVATVNADQLKKVS